MRAMMPTAVRTVARLSLAVIPARERQSDFAIIAPNAGPTSNYLWQYRLADDGTGRVGATFVRRLGTFSSIGEIEAVAVDDELGYVYYADEGTGIHKWAADGLDVTSAPLGGDCPAGLVVAMNSARRNFLLFGWPDIAALASPPLMAAARTAP